MKPAVINLERLGLTLLIHNPDRHFSRNRDQRLECSFNPRHAEVTKDGQRLGILEGDFRLDELMGQWLIRGYDGALRAERVIPLLSIRLIALKNGVANIVVR